MFQTAPYPKRLRRKSYFPAACLVSLVAITIFGAPNKTAQAETWTDVSGKFSIDAKFAGVETATKSVVLLKQDGSKISVPIARLSPESRNQARQAYEQMLVVDGDSAQTTREGSDASSAIAPANTRSLDFQAPAPPAVEPMQSFPANLSVRETIDFLKTQTLAGHPEVFWHALPDPMRATFDDARFRNEISPFVEQQSPLQSQIEPVVLKAIKVLLTKKEFVLGSPMLQQAPPHAVALLQRGYDPAVGVVYEFADFAFSFDTTGDRSVSQTVNYHGPRIGGHLKQLLQLVPEGEIDGFLNSLTIEKIDNDHAIVRVPESADEKPKSEFQFEFTTREAKLVRVADRWVTEEIYQQWKDLDAKLQSGELKQAMEQMKGDNAENIQGAAMIVGMFAGMANALLDSLLAADTQQEFDEAVAQASAMPNLDGGGDDSEIEFQLESGDEIPFGNDGSMKTFNLNSGAPRKPAVLSGPAPEGWSLDLASVVIPANPAAAVVGNATVKITEASISDGILKLAMQQNNREAYSWVIFTFLDEGEKIDGKTFQINTDSGFSSPHVHFHYSTADGSRETEMFMKDYAMRLEFGEMLNGKLPGKIYLCLPDSNKSVLRGTFIATDISTSLR